MRQGSRNAPAGGFLIALSIIVGTLGGGLAGEPTIGFLAGTVAGILLAILIWLRSR